MSSPRVQYFGGGDNCHPPLCNTLGGGDNCHPPLCNTLGGVTIVTPHHLCTRLGG